MSSGTTGEGNSRIGAGGCSRFTELKQARWITDNFSPAALSLFLLLSCLGLRGSTGVVCQGGVTYASSSGSSSRVLKFALFRLLSYADVEVYV